MGFGISKVWADPATVAYLNARECYENLKVNPELQARRDRWEACIAQFEAVARQYPRHQKGREAEFSVGKLYEGLASNSKNQADWLKSVEEYESFAKRHQKDKLADDAYYWSAVIRWERFHDKTAAKRNLIKITKFYKKSDMAGEARKYLDAVNKGVVPESKPQATSRRPQATGYPPRATSDPPASPREAARLAWRAGERRTTIVIDPGHGGDDSGAIGHKRTREKDITLDISKRLAEELKKDPKIKISLTREADKTLTLNDRTRLANKMDADLFVSIHTNAAKSKKQRGIQTYFLNNATDEASRRLAEQENKNAGRETSDLEKIIATMIQNASTVESQEFANIVHKELINRLSKKYKGVVDQNVRSALFYVLVGTKCPSILVETSYISNPKEELRLKKPKYQSDVARAIAEGIRKYMNSEKFAVL